MILKTEIKLSAQEVQAVVFYGAFHGPRKVGADVESSLNEKEKELYKLGETIDQNVLKYCGGTSLPGFWLEENKNGGVYVYLHPLRRNY